MMHNNLRKDERGQTALEAAIILIAFVVVASIFAFTVLSAGASTTEKGEEAIYAGLEGVQSSMSTRGAIIATGDTTTDTVSTVVFTVSPVAGGDPLDVNAIVIGYRDNTQAINSIANTTITWIRHADSANTTDPTEADDLLEDGELAEITLDLAAESVSLGPNTNFTIELKPPTGAVFSMDRTTPAAIEAVMELR
jgi:flagellin FlaB